MFINIPSHKPIRGGRRRLPLHFIHNAMAQIARSFYDLNYIDTLSCLDSPVHRIDPRAKLITFVVFIACVVSYNKYEISGLIPFFFFPAVIIPIARIPARYLVKKLLFLLPFAVLIGVFNPVYDRHILFSLGTLPVSGGVVSFVSILHPFYPDRARSAYPHCRDRV